MKFTVLGATGFVGGYLADSLRSQGISVYTPDRHEPDWLEQLLSKDLGHVFYCIGLTANFRQRPFDTVEAHVCLLRQILEHANMESLTYMSSTRVYENSVTTDEAALLQGIPTNPGHLYNFSKLMGESLCLASSKKTKVVRLSNVYGEDINSKNFLTSVLKEAALNGSVQFLTSPESSKDYISIKEVVRFLPRIAIDGVYPLYNLATGQNTTNAEIAHGLECEGIKTSYSNDANHWSFPKVDVTRLEMEFGLIDNTLERDLPSLLNYYRLKV
ncbi:MAG: NAD-dependent epimerase/dehydratase family protein [Methylotenera sp.]